MARSPRKKNRPHPLLLIVLEGFGIAPAHAGNALSEARPEYLTGLMSHYPTLSLSTSPAALGLLPGTIVNSEIGHTIIGTGAVPYDPRVEIDSLIGEEGFFRVPALEKNFKKGGRVHLIGLISASEREASVRHVRSLIQTALRKGMEKIFVHAILDGRDSGTTSGKALIAELEGQLDEKGVVASLCGRFYALDPFRRPERLKRAAEAIMVGHGGRAQSALAELERQYEQKIFDEEFPPTVIGDGGQPRDGDVIVFFNFNGHYLKGLASEIAGMADKRMTLLSLTDYGIADVLPVLKPATRPQSIGSVISGAGLAQWRLADSEGFGSVTSFLNGGNEEKFSGEDREAIPVPLTEHYGDQPEMGNEAVARRLLQGIEERKYGFIAVTMPSLDRLGHEGNMDAAIQGVTSIDETLKKVVTATLAAGGAAIITSSHGRAEQTVSPLTETAAGHTNNPVPLLIVAPELAGYSLGLPQPVEGDLNAVPLSGTLLDVAPTVLGLLGLPVPSSMGGRNFLAEAKGL